MVPARMAEQADAGGLNPPDGNILRVQVPLRALHYVFLRRAHGRWVYLFA